MEPDPALRERIVAAVGDTRRRDTRRDRLQRALAVAAAAVFLVGVGAVLNRPAPGPTLEEVALADVPADVAADAALITHTWGTELVLTVDGLQDGQDYVVTFVSDAGERVSAGTFIGVDDRPVVCRMNAAVLRNEASAFEVATPDGRLVMRADI